MKKGVTKPTPINPVVQCTQEVKAILDKYNLAFDVVAILRQGSIQTRLELVSKPKEDAKK